MDKEVCKAISKLINKISTNPKAGLEEKPMKDLMSYAGQTQVYMKYTHERLLKQLEKKHSEIRLGTFLIINAFFKKSSFYREMLLDDFRPLLDLTLGDKFKPLPPPEEAAENLRVQVLTAFQKWHSKFSKAHQRLPIAYNYIKNVLNIDLDDDLKRSHDERAKAEEEERHIKNSERAKLEKIRQEFNENHEDIIRLVTEIKNGLCLILPKPDEFLGDTGKTATHDNDGDTDDDTDEEVDFQEHGIKEGTTITIKFNPFSKPKIEQNEDNEAIIENLRGLYAVAKNRYLPLIQKWFLITSKSDDSIFFKQVLDLKDSLSFEVNSFEDLNLIPVTKSTLAEDMEISESDEDEDDSDFEEVPEKEGYEEFAIAPPVIPKASNNIITSSSSSKKPAAPSSTITSWSLTHKPQSLEDCHDPTYGLKPDKLKAVLINSTCDKPGTSTMASPSKSVSTDDISTRKEKLLQVAPKLPYDIDLYHWEDKDLKPPTVEVADTGLHRFWQPLDREGETVECQDGVNALRTRVIEFTGKFEPVNRTCRAPLPTGKLCPRQDRIKCPFHGKIISRDEQGKPTDPEERARLEKEEKKAEEEKVPDWQEPKYLAQLKEQIGIDLTIRRPKKGGKSFSDKYPNLTDIRKLKDTPRARLEKKVFNKQSLKRVAESTDQMNKKRFTDKYSDQFNYTHL